MNAATHLAILGRQPELGLIELESVLGSGAVGAFGDNALITSLPAIDRLGGSIKLGRIIAKLPQQRLDQLDSELGLLPHRDAKLTFAISAYGLKLAPRELEAFGLSLKKRLKTGKSVRLVLPKAGSNELSAAQLKFNRLPEAGFELLVASDGHDLVLALTEAVQDIDAYSARDHQRPARSAKVGMLPPKLAQILLNTTHAQMVYDPFCGTGVILQEGLLAGRTVYGSDLAPEMVEASRTNLRWLEESHSSLPKWRVDLGDARSIVLPREPLAIVSEGYLGPNLTTNPRDSELESLMTPLLDLYRQTLANLASQLPSGAEVSLCAPAWNRGNAWKALPIVDEAANLGYIRKDFETVPASTIVYGRPGQAVGRALILLRKV